MSKLEWETDYYNNMLKPEGERINIYMTTNQPPNLQKSEAVKYCEEHYPEMCQLFLKLQADQYELLCKKQRDYGPSNIALGTRLSTIQEIKASLMGIVIRANDKMQRLLNLTVISQREPENESIEDSFMDLAVYANIALIVKSRKWGK